MLFLDSFPIVNYFCFHLICFRIPVILYTESSPKVVFFIYLSRSLNPEKQFLQHQLLMVTNIALGLILFTLTSLRRIRLYYFEMVLWLHCRFMVKFSLLPLKRSVKQKTVHPFPMPGEDSTWRIAEIITMLAIRSRRQTFLPITSWYWSCQGRHNVVKQWIEHFYLHGEETEQDHFQ